VFFGTYWTLVIDWLTVLGILPWVLLTLISVFPFLLLGVQRPHVNRLSGAFTFVGVFVLVEYVHANFPWGGFPWGLLAYTQTHGPLMVFARVGGQYLVTLVVVLIATMLTQWWSLRSWLRIAFMGGVVGILQISLTDQQITTTVRVAAIQGSVPRSGYDFETQRRAVLENHLAATQKLIAQSDSNVDLVVWPENAVDNDPLNNSYVRNRVSSLSSQLSSPLLVGGVVTNSETGNQLNAGILWARGEPGEIYAKHQLVPFGEYIPFATHLSKYVKDYFYVLPNMVPGNQSGIFTLSHGTKFGDVICFEIANEEYVRQRVIDGAQFITVQTNNATYEHTSQPEQQLNITRFRAIENQRDIVVAATTGYTVTIDARGQLQQQVQPLKQGYIVDDLAVSDGKQLVQSWGSRWVILFSLMCAVFGLRKYRR
jgi:apolipoprotein N-acyltransferase